MAHDPSKTAVTYADAGVDIDRANRTKKRIKYLAHKTFTRGVLSEIGGFGGLFAVDKEKCLDPILVSSVDGVGTKLKVAFEMDLHHTVGADLVNHCVNDIAVQGATPLFFMDYLATGKLEPEVSRESRRRTRRRLQAQRLRPDRRRNCRDARLLSRRRVRPGRIHRRRGRSRTHHYRQDVEVGDVFSACPRTACTPTATPWLASCCSKSAKYTLDTYVNEIKGKVGNELHAHPQELLADDQEAAGRRSASPPWPTSPAAASPKICRASCLTAWPPSSKSAPGRCRRSSNTCSKLGNVPQDEMLRTFNMGMGMLLVVPAKKFKKAQTVLERAGEKVYTVGTDCKGRPQSDVHLITK